MRRETMGNGVMALFPYVAPGVGGAVVKFDTLKSGSDGSLVYLNGGDDLAQPLSRVESAGGKLILPKTAITPEIGYFALFADTEGNRVGIHSPH